MSHSGLLKRAANTASASIVTGAMGRLGALIDKVTAAPKPSDRDVVIIFILGSVSLGEFSSFKANRVCAIERAQTQRGAKSAQIILGALRLDRSGDAALAALTA